MSRPASHLGTSQANTRYPGIQSIQGLGCLGQPASHLGTSQANTRHPGIQSIQGLECLGQPAIWGHPRLVLGIPGYKVFKDWWSRPTSHLGKSQANTRYPGIQSIQGLGCLGQPASHLGTSQANTRHPGIQSIQGLECLGQPAIWGHPRLVLGIPGYKVFKDWWSRPTSHLGKSQANTRYPGIQSIQGLGCLGQPASHLGTSQANTRHPGIQSIQGLGCLGQPAIWGHPRLILGIRGYKVFKDWGI